MECPYCHKEIPQDSVIIAVKKLVQMHLNKKTNQS